MKNENSILTPVMSNYIYKESEKLDQCVIKHKLPDFTRHARLSFG